MTPELKAQLDARLGELIAQFTPEQRAEVASTGTYKQVPLTRDTGWQGVGVLEFSITEYFGPSELEVDGGAEFAGAQGTAKYFDGATTWLKSVDFGKQPSRNRDWVEVRSNEL